MDIFTFSQYEDYLKQQLKTNKSVRGYKTRLAQALNVHGSYISRVIEGSVLLTPDQAVSLAQFWGLSEIQSEYFLWLVLKSRASHSAFQKTVANKLKELIQKNCDLESSLKIEKIQSDEFNQYYINWLYSAIHILGTLKNPLTIPKISERLGRPIIETQEAVEVLKKMGLVEVQKDSVVVATKKRIFLSNRNWISSVQHTNWRLMGLEKLGRPHGDDVRYTGIHSLSRKHLIQLKKMIKDFLVDTDSLVGPSEAETVCTLCIDLFEI